LAAGRPEEYVERLAHHALRAERWGQAAEFLRRAGLRCVSRSANREAAIQFRTALECVERLPDTDERAAQAFDLHLQLVNSAFPLRDFDMVTEHRLKAEALAAKLDDPLRTSRIALSLGMQSWLMGKLGEAVEASGRVIRIASELGNIGLLARGQDILGRALFSQGNYRQALEVVGRNLAMLVGDLEHDRFGVQGIISVFSRHFAARSYAAMGAFEEGRACAERALAVAGDHPHSVLSASSALAMVARERGEFQVVAATLERALALSESLDIRVWIPILASDLGYAYALSGRVAEALPLLELGAVTLGNDGPARLAHLSVGYLQEGCVEEALATAERARALAGEMGERGNEAAALRILGDIASQLQPSARADAAEHYLHALALAEPRGMRPVVAHCLRGLGSLYRRAGRPAEGTDYLERAGTMYREMGMTYWLEKAQAELVELG
jgi:tetratricopeptide (TPR) repeat protein